MQQLARPKVSDRINQHELYYFSKKEVGMKSKIVFMGTPEFAVPSLKVLAARLDAADLLVVTQPDRASGRGRTMQAPPVKRAAGEHELSVLQARTLKDSDVRRQLEVFAPDLIVVAAFGLILPRWVLELPRRGCVNLHASDLPRFRGASPIAAAIEMGDSLTAVSLMEMERGLDTGGVYARDFVDISKIDTTESLTATMADSAARLLGANFMPLLNGELEPTPQSGQILETRKIVKDHGVIDWSVSAEEIEHHVRAMWPWPRAWTIGDKELRVQIHAADVVEESPGLEPGVASVRDGGVVIGTGHGALRLTTVQLPGKGAQSASDLKQHPVFATGTRFGTGSDYETPAPWIVEAGEA